MRGFNLILEGCDGVGKTTIFKKMLRRGDFMIGMHTDAPTSKESYKKQITKEIEQLNTHIGLLYDRSFLSECVYAPLVRGYYPEYMRELEKTIKPHTILVLLTAPSYIIEERYDGKVLRKDQIAECLDRYHTEFQKCNITHKCMINSGIKNPSEVLKEIFRFIKNCGFEYSYYLEDLIKGE